MNRPINDIWKDYKEKVVPKTASEVQVAETQIAFFSGALGLYEYIMLHALDASEETTGRDLKAMEEVHDELRDFAEKFGLESNKSE